MNDCPTTRRFPRSLMEAFQIDNADTIEHYRATRSWLFADATIAAILVVVLAALFLGMFK